MNSYGDGNTYRGTVCKDSEVPTTITDGKTAYTAKHYIDMIEEEIDQSRLFKHLVGEPSFKIKSPQENIYPLALNSSVAF